MKFATFPPTADLRRSLFSFFALTPLMISLALFSQVASGQQIQLSLADLLIGLRSKKATLPEKNKILTDAAKVRGITFALTPEIEKELANTGADQNLLETIRLKSPSVKPAPPSIVIPAVTPSAPDSAAFQKSAKAHIVKGEFDLAIADYNKSIELSPKDSAAFMNRGLAFYNQKKYDLAIADYSKSIELSPKESITYFNRGDSYEKAGNAPKAVADYQKAIELDATNEPAKTYLQRLQADLVKHEQAAKAEQLKAEQAKAEQVRIEQTKAAKAAETPVAAKLPESIEIGQLNEIAVKLVTPVYPPIAQKSNIQGAVIVQLSLDEGGKVVSAKATAGPAILRSAAEDAAHRSKFKPSLIGTQAVKATGFIKYNFKL